MRNIQNGGALAVRGNFQNAAFQNSGLRPESPESPEFWCYGWQIYHNRQPSFPGNVFDNPDKIILHFVILQLTN